mmetsp:Transcript_30655/g.43993  ORF Transcript_30655/g.43993 Transcript_30655/m.43993 type:complete len:536 (-) Transcript_30655:236-1843(-)
MMSVLTGIVLLSLLQSTDAIFQAATGGILLNFGKNKLTAELRKLVLPGLNLPSKRVLSDKTLLGNLVVLTGTSSIDLINFSPGAGNLLKIEGQPKSEIGLFKAFQDYYVDKVIDHKKELLPQDYKYFGSASNVENLELLLQNNPFFANTLTQTSMGSNTFRALTLTDIPTTSLFTKLISTLDGSYPRVNAVFNSKLQLISHQVFDGATGAPLTKTKEEAAGDLLFLMMFHAECLHALIHVFHYINVVAMNEAALSYPMLELWAKPYLANIAVKYEEVEALLLGSDKALTGAGFRSDGDAVRAILKDVLCEWGSYKTANEFIDNFLLGACRTGSVRKAGLLPQFLKHADLIGPFSNELGAAFAKYQPDLYTKANQKVCDFLSDCGRDISQIDDIPTWIQLMSVTGIMHGSTLSFSRVILTEEMLKRVTTSDVYSSLESGLASTVGGTTVGMIEDRHVFSAAMQQETIRSTLNKVKLMDPIAKQVLIKYDALSSKLKTDLYNSLCKDPKKFREQGWVLTDHCPDGVDGKQLTITTYI